MRGYVVDIPAELVQEEVEDGYMESVFRHMSARRQGLEAAITDVSAYLMKRAEADDQPMDLMRPLVVQLETSVREGIDRAREIVALADLTPEASDAPFLS